MKTDPGNVIHSYGKPELFRRPARFVCSVTFLGCAALAMLGWFAAGLAGAQRPEGTGPAAAPALAQAKMPAPPDGAVLVPPEELARQLKSGTIPGPLVVQVGFQVLFIQAHIPGSEFIGPATSAEAIRKLRSRVASLPREQPIVIYCGCCPWEVCPNVSPAVRELHGMGFRSIKVLYIEDNFGKDWVAKGFPVEKGK